MVKKPTLTANFFAITLGNNRKLSVSELESVVCGAGGRMKTVFGEGRIATFKIPITERALESLQNLALTRIISFHDASGTSLKELSRKLVLPAEDSFSFSVSVPIRKVQGISRSLAKVQLGRLVQEREGGRAVVNLKNPDVDIILAILGDGLLLAGRRIVDCDTAYMTRRLRARPFFHPSMMHARLARGLCNLAGAGPKKSVLDPFCGGGSTLLEASLMGASIFGIDNSRQMIDGCKANLGSFNIASGNVLLGDARNIKDCFPDKMFDCVATDPPYGRGASTGGVGIGELYSNAFSSINDSLKPGGLFALCLPDQDLLGLVEKAGFVLKSYNTIRVHKSLVRHVCSFEKKQ